MLVLAYVHHFPSHLSVTVALARVLIDPGPISYKDADVLVIVYCHRSYVHISSLITSALLPFLTAI